MIVTIGFPFEERSSNTMNYDLKISVCDTKLNHEFLSLLQNKRHTGFQTAQIALPTYNSSQPNL